MNATVGGGRRAPSVRYLQHLQDLQRFLLVQDRCLTANGICMLRCGLLICRDIIAQKFYLGNYLAAEFPPKAWTTSRVRVELHHRTSISNHQSANPTLCRVQERNLAYGGAERHFYPSLRLPCPDEVVGAYVVSKCGNLLFF